MPSITWPGFRGPLPSARSQRLDTGRRRLLPNAGKSTPSPGRGSPQWLAARPDVTCQQVAWPARHAPRRVVQACGPRLGQGRLSVA